MSKPTAADILALVHDLRDDNADRDAAWDRLDALYDQVGDDDPNPAVKRIIMPYATNAVDLITDLAAQQTLTISVPAAKDTQGAHKEADEREAWLRAWLDLNSQRRNNNYTADMAWHGSMRGVVVLRTIFSDKLVKPKPDDDGFTLHSVPVLLQVRDPRHVYWLEDAEGPTKVVEVFKRKASEIRLLYPGVLDDDTTGQVDWCEYWDDTHRAYFVNGRLVEGKARGILAHGYGVLPYTFAPARTTPRRAPEQRYRPLLMAVEETLADLDTWFSILATAGWQTVTSSWNVFSDEYGRDGGKVLHTGPGDINYFAQKDVVQPLQRATLPPDFFKLGDLFLQALQQGTFPFAMYGQLNSNMAGYAINLLSQSGRRPILPIWEAIARAYQGAFRSCVLICRNKVAPLVGDAVGLLVQQAGEERAALRSLKLDTNKIGDDFIAHVELTDPMPQDEAQNLRLALESTGGDAPLLSHQTALTKYKVVEDAAAEMERIEAESVFRQLAPYEAVKIAIERGYLPAQIKLPAGYVMGPQGQLMPASAMPQQPEQGGLAEMLMSGALPSGGAAPDAAALQGMAGMPPPANLDQLAGMPPPEPGL